jgi:hypothetical protein
MGSRDRKIRGEAVTLRGSIFGHNYQDETEYDLTQGAWTNQASFSDICNLVGINPADGTAITPSPNGFNSIRILQPHFGELVECYIDFVSVHYPFDSFGTPGHNGAGSNDLQFGIGDFTNNDHASHHLHRRRNKRLLPKDDRLNHWLYCVRRRRCSHYPEPNKPAASAL